MRIGNHDITRRVFIVAEAGNNHEGDFARAIDMVAQAAATGVDAIKFQTIVPERLVSRREAARIAQLSRYRFSYEQFGRLAAAASKAGVAFLSTPFDIESARALAPLVPAFKIASGDNDFWPLVDACAGFGKPLLVSTGLLDLAGARRIVAHVGGRAPLVLLHCVTAYPVPAEEANVAAITALAGLGVPVGYSDHTLGLDACLLAVALGARVLEKHFTLDKNQSEFRDHKLSADPAEMAEMVRRVRGAELLLGDGVKRVMPAEQASAGPARRAIVAARDLAAGAAVAAGDLDWVRPRRGLEPGREAELVGRRLAVAVAAGDPILPEHLA